jgi:hypothetical protein
VKGFSQLVVPLTYITKKRAFRWSKEEHGEFDRMNKEMNTIPMLSLSDFSQPFVLECDAFREGIGAMLMDNQHPITFEIRKPRELERLYPIYDTKMLGIMHALENFIWYMIVGRFVVRSDHNSLRYFLEKRDLSER